MKTVVDHGAAGTVADEIDVRRQAERTCRDAQRYKAGQRRQWDQAAPGLRTWWTHFEQAMEPVTHAMVTHAQLRPGDHAVDVASGFGEPGLTIAHHVGDRGRVVITDLSAAMLAGACERASVLGIGNVDFVQMDAEAPTLARAGYESVVCRLGLMFLPDLDVALTRLGALLVPGGRFVAAVWGPPQHNLWLTVALSTLTEFLELPAPAAGGPGPFGLAAPGRLADALAAAGVAGLRQQRVALDFRWPSPAAYAAFHQASPLQRVVAGQPAALQTRAWTEVAVAAQRCWGSGPLRLPGEVTVVSGTRPAGQLRAKRIHRLPVQKGWSLRSDEVPVTHPTTVPNGHADCGPGDPALRANRARHEELFPEVVEEEGRQSPNRHTRIVRRGGLLFRTP